MQNWKKNTKFNENVKTATAGALKRRGGPLRDNLSDLPERKAPRRELSSAVAHACGKSLLGTRDKTIAVGGTCPL